MTDQKPMPNTIKRRHAFSLTEVMVVLGIVAVVLAVLVPKIMQTAEAARRTQCRNNLAQLSLALHSYEAVHGVFPPGTINQTGPIENIPEGYHAAWTVQMLPYLEQQFLATSVDPLFSIYSSGIASTPLPTLSCPSQADLKLTTNGAWPSSYAACYGSKETGINYDNNGSFFLNSSLTNHDIRDGSTNTIFFGEKVQSESDLGWTSGTSSTLRSTFLRPNNGFDRLLELGDTRNGGFGSAHPNGTLFGFGDGSVRLLRNNIDMEIFRQLGNRHDGKLTPKDY